MRRKHITEKPDLLFYDGDEVCQIEATNYRGCAFLKAYADACEHGVTYWHDDDAVIEGIEIDVSRFDNFKREARLSGVSLDNAERDWPYPYGERPSQAKPGGRGTPLKAH